MDLIHLLIITIVLTRKNGNCILIITTAFQEELRLEAENI